MGKNVLDAMIGEIDRLNEKVAVLQTALDRYRLGVEEDRLHRVLRKWINDEDCVGSVCMGIDVPKDWIGQCVRVLVMKEPFRGGEE